MKNQITLKFERVLKPTLFFYLLVLFLSLQSCQKDQDQLPLTSLLGEPKMQTVKGRVVDESGNPVSGATVQAGYGTETTTTDANGVFIIKSIKGFTKLGYIKVTKSGYLPGSRSFSPVKSGSNIIEIMLLQKNLAGTVSAVSGGTVTVEGVKITFPANGFVKNGQTYSGNVKVEANYIDPASPTLQQEMPGSLLGALDNQAYGLESFGMIGVELSDDNGNKIDLAPGSKATINFPLPASIVSNAPGTIDLWSFDDISGIWKHEGTAQKINGQYVAEVTHFSWWNVDVPFEFKTVEGVVKDNQGNTLSNRNVKCTSNQVLGFSQTTTNEYGYYTLQVPSLGNITLICYSSGGSCFLGSPVTYQLGQVNSNTIRDITIPDVQNLQNIVGNLVDCNQSPIANGYVKINGIIYYCDVNGQFNAPICVASSINVIGCNLSLLQYSDNLTYTTSIGVTNIGNIIVCGSIDTSAAVDIDGNSYSTLYIGNRKLMATNLRTTKFNDGTPIQLVADSIQWASTAQPAYCYYNNYQPNQNAYGNLYNYRTITSSKNVCPVGWHVPTPTDYFYIMDIVGDSAGKKMKQISLLWEVYSNIANTNSSGFSALPSGNRNHSQGKFDFVGKAAYFAVSNGFGHFGFTFDSNLPFTSPNEPNFGMSIRCVKD